MEKTIRITLPNGEKLRKHIHGADEKEIEQKVQQIIHDAMRGKPLSAIVDEWQEYHFKDINPNTQSGYIAPIKDIKEHLGSCYLDEINPLDVEQFLYMLYDERKYARQTLKLRLIVLNQVYNYCLLKGYCQNNPCLPVRLPRNAFVGKRELPPTESINAVKSALQGEFGLLPFFLLYTGCRIGEALALTYEDIDRKNKVINISKTVIFIDGKPTIQEHTKTSAGNRSVPLLAPLEKALPKRKKGYIFTDNDELYRKGAFYYQWRQYEKRIGVEISPHQLRHAYATILYDAGLPVKDSQLLLGHASAEVTQNIYTHISEERKKNAYETLQNYVQE